MSKSDFENNITKISQFINAYVRLANKTSYACIVLHDHLGLVQNIVQTCEFLLGDRISLVIPDLFLSVTNKTLLNNEFDAVKKLKFSRVLLAVQACYNELIKSHSKIVLMGFSIGSAYGWKILQKMPDKFESAFLYYGVPSFTNWSPSKIKTKVIAFSGSDDKIKYLSDLKTCQQFSKFNSENKLIKFQLINGVGHGFANTESDQFSKSAMLYAKKMMFTVLPTSLSDVSSSNIQIQEDEKKDGCMIF